MTLGLVLSDLLAAVVQGTVLAFAAAAFVRVFPVERAGARLAWWQAVLIAVLAWPVLQPWVPTSAGHVETRVLGISLGRDESTAHVGHWPWAEATAAVLVAGVLARGAWLAAGLGRLRRLRSQATLLAPSNLFAPLAAITGVQATFLVSDEVRGPATFGLRHPVVLVPSAFLRMAPERQRAIALHELLHVRRHDWLATVAEEALATVLWFHPAVHFLVARIRLAREASVDEAVVRALGAREVYLEALVEMARQLLPHRAVPAVLLLGERHLRHRVELLLKEVAMSRVRTLSHLAAGAACMLLVGVLGSYALPLEVTAAKANEAAPVEKATKSTHEPRIVHKVPPVYPPEAKDAHLEGVVHIDVRIGKDGAVAEAKAVDGHPTLAEAALAAVRQWRYEPVLGPGKKPIEAILTITINFRLE